MAEIAAHDMDAVTRQMGGIFNKNDSSDEDSLDNTGNFDYIDKGKRQTESLPVVMTPSMRAQVQTRMNRNPVQQCLIQGQVGTIRGQTHGFATNSGNTVLMHVKTSYHSLNMRSKRYVSCTF